MMTKDDFNFIEVYDDAFYFNDFTIEYFEKNKNFHNRRSEREIAANIIDTYMFLEQDSESNEANKIKYEVKKSVQNCFNLYSKKYRFCKQFSLNIFKNYLLEDGHRIQKTDPKEGFNYWHAEKNYGHDEITEDGNIISKHNNEINRFLVYSIYLNDVEEGGETAFLYQDVKVKPKKGRICLWPADFMFIHKGVPPISETKYIITGWLCLNMSLSTMIE